MSNGSPSVPPGGRDPRRPRVVVKLIDGVSVEKDDDADIREELHSQNVTLTLPPAARVERLFRGATGGELQALRERAIALQGDTRRFANLRSHLSIAVDDDTQAAQVLAALRGPLREVVQYAYVAPRVELPRVTPDDEPEYPLQSYLRPSPEGVGAGSAWRELGGDGSELILADVEAGWDLSHDDLASLPVAFTYGSWSPDPALMGHGSGVLGIIGSRDNEKGLIGIAPNLAAVGLCSYISKDRDPVEAAISYAVKSLASLGDNLVLLLEVTYGWVWDFTNHEWWRSMPVESAPAIHDILQVATGAGVVVIEPAGNGTRDLDGFVDLTGRKVFDRTVAGFDGSDLDSGAIVVGASTYGAFEEKAGFWQRQRLNASNWSTRVDCHAPGELLRTATSANGFTSHFGGTSGASAIVAGVAVALQGVSRYRRDRGLTPDGLRTLLRDPANGYAPSSSVRGAIGSMPNLEALIKAL